MELYDKTDNKKHGKFKLSHFDIGKLLKCAIHTDKYGNIYYRHLTMCIRDNLFLGRDYIIEPKVKNQQGQRTWFVTKESLFILTLLLRGGKKYRADMSCDERLQRDQRKYFGHRFAQANASGQGRTLALNTSAPNCGDHIWRRPPVRSTQPVA